MDFKPGLRVLVLWFWSSRWWFFDGGFGSCSEVWKGCLLWVSLGIVEVDGGGGVVSAGGAVTGWVRVSGGYG